MTRVDAFALGLGMGVGAVAVWHSITGPPSRFESWVWRVMEARG